MLNNFNTNILNVRIKIVKHCEAYYLLEIGFKSFDTPTIVHKNYIWVVSHVSIHLTYQPSNILSTTNKRIVPSTNWPSVNTTNKHINKNNTIPDHTGAKAGENPKAITVANRFNANV